MAEYPLYVDQTALILDMIYALPRAKRAIVLAIRAGNEAIPTISRNADLDPKVTAIILKRLIKEGLVVRDGTIPKPPHIKGRELLRFRLRNGLAEAMAFLQSDPPWLQSQIQDQKAFWWDSNSCWGWIWHPTLWLVVLAFHRNDPDLASKARKAEWHHHTAMLSGAQVQESFGFRREHTGETLAGWARYGGLTWV